MADDLMEEEYNYYETEFREEADLELYNMNEDDE